jgi:iron complex transport system substrate-binding protein
MTEPRRIVSLVPSLSETVCAFGLQSELVGCTKFCVEPKNLHRTATRVGGTKDFDVGSIRSLRPTHILANQEENPRDPVLELARDFPTLVSFPKGPRDVPAMLRDLGQFLGCVASAESWALAIEQLLEHPPQRKPLRFLYLIWQNPYMAVGHDTYIAQTLAALGWVNAYAGPERYPTLTVKAMQEMAVDVVMLSSEPYPFRQRDAQRLSEQWPQVPRLVRVDGRLLSWFGTTTREALERLCGEEAGWLREFSLP